jgi:hypothetical protein
MEKYETRLSDHTLHTFALCNFIYPLLSIPFPGLANDTRRMDCGLMDQRTCNVFPLSTWVNGSIIDEILKFIERMFVAPSSFVKIKKE